ncbi:SH3 domain-containing protein [Lacinutrix jangbogonensis]|uniref:SH3 domain-containing protein n=1 Tax=Lacinutrix jangbogonensis TaxID=1469557 RepID=UPI00068FB7F7|nr:SH3 domain-containing protein [Lacinutrix jangbogonensis]
MKTTKHFLTAILLLLVAFSYGQDYAYVNADSGLTVRERPDIGASKLGKLMYNEAVEVVEKTKVKLVVVDQGNKISGEWVKIKMNGYQDLKGYVFNGFLSETKIPKIINVKFSEANVHIKNLSIVDDDAVRHLDYEDNLVIDVKLGHSPENKTIVIKDSNYKSVKVLQRYENSITIMNEGPHCDLIDWKHYNSDWKPVKKINEFKFETLSYSEADYKKFLPVTIDDLKLAVSQQCGEDWAKYIEKVTAINQYPAGVTTSRIFIKFILTDFENIVTEKTIEFVIPMGC